MTNHMEMPENVSGSSSWLCPGWESNAHSKEGKTWRQSLPWRLTQARSNGITEDTFPRSARDIRSPVTGQAGNPGVVDSLGAEKV